MTNKGLRSNFAHALAASGFIAATGFYGCGSTECGRVLDAFVLPKPTTVVSCGC
jgi:hypothetical protein